MSRLDLSRSSKSLMERVGAMIRATLPRQARVTRTEGNSVWVRFLGDEAGGPESKLPSTVAGVPAGTMGWVITLGGKKGLFVATGIAVPDPLTSRANVSVPVVTAGVNDIPGVLITFTGLVPGRTYKVDATAEFVAGSSGEYFPTFTAIGATTQRPATGPRSSISSARTKIDTRAVVTVTANSAGEISVAPAYQWGSGSFTFSWAGITATIS